MAVVKFIQLCNHMLHRRNEDCVASLILIRIIRPPDLGYKRGVDQALVPQLLSYLLKPAANDGGRSSCFRWSTGARGNDLGGGDQAETSLVQWPAAYDEARQIPFFVKGAETASSSIVRMWRARQRTGLIDVT